MRFLCLAYEDAKDWNDLNKELQNRLPEQNGHPRMDESSFNARSGALLLIAKLG